MVYNVPQTTHPQQATKYRVNVTATGSTEQTETELLCEKWTLKCTKHIQHHIEDNGTLDRYLQLQTELWRQDCVTESSIKEHTWYFRGRRVSKSRLLFWHARTWHDEKVRKSRNIYDEEWVLSCSVDNLNSSEQSTHSTLFRPQETRGSILARTCAVLVWGIKCAHNKWTGWFKMHAHHFNVYVHDIIQQLCTSNEQLWQCRMP